MKRCYCLSDRDCTSRARPAVGVRRWSRSVKESHALDHGSIQQEDSSPALAPDVALSPERDSCPRCGADRVLDVVFTTTRVCSTCGYHERESARAAIARLVDAGSFRERDSGLVSTDPLQFADETSYRERLRRLRDETGESDALVSGIARL